jgi:hypothetical protein
MLSLLLHFVVAFWCAIPFTGLDTRVIPQSVVFIVGNNSYNVHVSQKDKHTHSLILKPHTIPFVA